MFVYIHDNILRGRCIYIYTLACMSPFVKKLVYRYMFVYLNSQALVGVFIDICVCRYTCVWVCLYIYVCIYMYVCICVYIYMCTRVHDSCVPSYLSNVLRF